MVNQDLLAYIRNAFELGLTKEKTEGELLAAGWNKTDVDAGFVAVERQTVPQPTSPFPTPVAPRANSKNALPGNVYIQPTETHPMQSNTSKNALMVASVVLNIVLILLTIFLFAHQSSKKDDKVAALQKTQEQATNTPITNAPRASHLNTVLGSTLSAEEISTLKQIQTMAATRIQPIKGKLFSENVELAFETIRSLQGYSFVSKAENEIMTSLTTTEKKELTLKKEMSLRDDKRISDIEHIKLSIEVYYDTNTGVPTSLRDLVPQFAKTIPKDEGTTSYVYVATDESGKICDPKRSNVCKGTYFLAANLEDPTSIYLNTDFDQKVPGIFDGSDDKGCDGKANRHCYDTSF